MPSGSRPEGEEENGTTQDRPGNAEQRDKAADLADRAAESVDRRYDATKEVHLGDTERDQPDGE
jgi:hypothetical protein